MKERPILFKGEMVRAILSGAKTQTRRVVKTAPAGNFRYDGLDLDGGDGHWFETLKKDGEPTEQYESIGECPYGQVGDRLWVRESCRGEELGSGLDGVRYSADNHFSPIGNTQSSSIGWLKLYTYRGKQGAIVPPIHMPRWASRITLEITGVSIERLNDISVEDARAEGCVPSRERIMVMGCKAGPSLYQELWESINGAGSWNANPWVWVVEFKRVEVAT